MLHAPTVGWWTCLLQKNALMQLVTPSLSIARQIGGPLQTTQLTIRDVSYMIMGTCISIRIPPEEGVSRTLLAFARKVIRNFACIIQHY